MPSSPLLEIKTYIQTHSSSEVEACIPRWQGQLRQQGISLMALESLLRTFSDEMPPIAPIEVGYIRPSEQKTDNEKELLNLRQYCASMDSKLASVESRLKTARRMERILTLTLIAAVLLVIALFVILVA